MMVQICGYLKPSQLTDHQMNLYFNCPFHICIQNTIYSNFLKCARQNSTSLGILVYTNCVGLVVKRLNVQDVHDTRSWLSMDLPALFSQPHLVYSFMGLSPCNCHDNKGI